MGLLPVAYPESGKTDGLLVVQAVGWRLGTFSVAHRKPRMPVYCILVQNALHLEKIIVHKTTKRSRVCNSTLSLDQNTWRDTNNELVYQV